MRRFAPDVLIATLIVAVTVVACATTASLRLSDRDQIALRDKLVGKDLVLAQSNFVFDFFGEKDRVFVEPRPSDILSLWREDGTLAPVPATSLAILPAGTPVRVRSIEYPLAGLKTALGEARPEAGAPTAHVWVVIERTDAVSALPLVVVLPREVDSMEAIESALSEHLVAPTWVSDWLVQRAPKTLAAICAKTVVPGMKDSEMWATLGKPRNFEVARAEGLLDYVADYGDIQATLSGNVVTHVISQKAVAEAARAEVLRQAEEARLAFEAQKAVEEQARAQEAAKAALESAKAEAERARLAALHEAALAKERKHQEELALKARLDAAKQAKLDAARDAKHQKEMEKLAKQVAKAEQEAIKSGKSGTSGNPGNSGVAASATKGPAAPAAPAPGQAPAVVAANTVAPVAPPVLSLGLSVSKVSKDDVFALGMKDSAGALVVDLKQDGVAALGGLKKHDVILRFNGQEIESLSDFAALAKSLTQQSPLLLQVWRGRQVMTVDLNDTNAPKQGSFPERKLDRQKGGKAAPSSDQG